MYYTDIDTFENDVLLFYRLGLYTHVFANNNDLSLRLVLVLFDHDTIGWLTYS